MESDAPKRRRSSTDNPVCNNSDVTDVSPPPQKMLPRPRKKALNKKDSDVKSSSTSNTTNSRPPESPPTPFKEITFNEAFDDFELDGTERQNLLSDVQKVMARFQRGEPDIEGIGEIEATLRDIGRFNDVLYLYVRFARQQPDSNFNTESLSSLLSVAKQCHTKPPYTLLTKIKSISIHRNASTRYGVAFCFVTRNNKDVDGVLLEKKFLGLKYTLKLLQSTIVKSDTILGKANAKQTGAHLPPHQECNTTTTATKSFCLDTKLWLGITHRWLAYHIVYHLFSRDKDRCWTADNIFVFSIRIFASSGKSRSDFLDPLVGVCLQFENSQDIKENQPEELAPIAADPSCFSSFGRSCLQNKKSEDKVKCIYNTFLSLQNTIQRKTIYFSLPPDSQWLLLKAYAFQLWLEQSRNQAMKKSVLQLLSVDNRKLPPPPQNNESNFTTPPLTQGLMISIKRSISSLKEPIVATPVKDGFPSTPKNGPSPSTTTTPKGGLQALLNTRRTNDTQFLESSPDIHPVITFRDLQTAINHTDCDWSNLRLFRTSHLDQFFTSYLIIRGEGRINFVSQASAIEVYSADNLHKLRHCRVNGNQDFYPTREQVGQVNLNIANKIEDFIDVSLKTLCIAREGSSMFKEDGESIPPIHHIANLCRAVIQHGTCDNKRSPGQRRAFIGNGGLSFPNGKPALIVDGGFRKKLTGDATLSLEEILKTIGGLTEFLWKTMANIQQQASDPPMAPNQSRHAAYANHLCTLLSMADCVSFEHITLVVSMINPCAPSNVLEHVDAMNDSVDGYTRTGALTMCFRMDGDKNHFKLGLMFQVIGNFRRVIGEYMVRQHRKEKECSPSLSPYSLFYKNHCKISSG